MAAVVRSHTTLYLGGASGSNSATLAKPAGTAEFDVLILVLLVKDFVASVTLPAGFTLLTTSALGTVGTKRIAWKRAGASEPASYTTTLSSQSQQIGALTAISGARREGSPIDSFGAQTSDGIAGVIRAPSIATLTANCLLLGSFAISPTSATLANPGVMSALYSRAGDANFNATVVGASQPLGSSGATGVRDATHSDPTSNYPGVGVLLAVSGNSAPNAPTLTATGTLNRDAPNRLSWTPSDPDLVDSQSAYDLRYRLGAGAWVTVSGSTPNAYRDFAAGTFVAGSYEWQVRTYDAAGLVGPYSASSFFTAASAPAGPAITDPINGQTISEASYLLTWSSSDQQEYEASILDADGAVVFTSGTVSSASARELLLSFPTNSASRTIRLRTRTAGLWSPYASVTVLVSYTTPAVAGVSVLPVKTLTYPGTDILVPGDFTDALRVGIANPAASGGQPTVAYHNVFLRCSASNPTADRQVPFSDVGTRVAVDHPAGQAYLYRRPASGVSYDVRVESIAANGTTSTSPWISDAVDLTPGTPGTPGDEGDYADASYSPVFYD